MLFVSSDLNIGKLQLEIIFKVLYIINIQNITNFTYKICNIQMLD